MIMRLIFLLGLIILPVGISSASLEDKAVLKVSFETSAPAKGKYGTENVHVVWIEDQQGNFVKTLSLWAYKRADDLRQWRSRTADIANDIDAKTTATQHAYGRYECFWNMTDNAGSKVSDGKYNVYFELTNDDAKRNRYHRTSVIIEMSKKMKKVSPVDKGGYKDIEIEYISGLEVGSGQIARFIINALPAGVLTLVIGTVFAIVLLIASNLLKVEVDPKVEQVQEFLPGVDCGACGFAGCLSYAKAVVNDPDLLGMCAPGGNETSEGIAHVLNLQMSDSGTPSRPVVHCQAAIEDKNFYAMYTGIESCTAANAGANVQACRFGCLGYGDCTGVCRFNALHIVDGLATVDYEKCTGCGGCIKACPRSIISMVPFAESNVLVVACRSEENGRNTRQMCRVGCIGCKMCTKQSEQFSMNGNVAVLDYENYMPDEKTEIAILKCPTKIITYRGAEKS